MIFEFFKKLFWKADERSRKRKHCEWHDKENDTLSKKSCQNVQSDKLSENGKFINTAVDKVNMQSNFNDYSSINSKNYENNNDKKSELIIKHDQWSSLLTNRNNNISKDDSLNKHFQSSYNLTLYKACHLIDRQKYSRMLLNFVNPDVENLHQNYTYNNNLKSIDKFKEGTKYVFFNNSFEHILNLRKESKNNSIYLCNQDSPETEQISSTNTNDRYQYNHKLGVHSSADSSIYIRSENISTTNTLKEHFATKEVIKQNFITQLNEKYNNSLEQRSKEAEEIKKMTHILAKHNRLTREATLQDHLNRSMRLCEVIFDEADSLEVELPQLDSSMISKIESALSSGPGNEVLVQEFGLRITRKDIHTLAGLNWLNDEVINFYMNLLIKRGNCGNYPTVYAMNTFFYPKLLSSGHIALKRWTRKIDIFSKDLIIVPIHLGIHWCMSIIDFRNKTVQYYDSMGSPNDKCLRVLKQYLQDESIDKKKKSFEFLGWNFECIKDIPKQMNGSDCGVFSCMFAEYVSANKKLDFTQEDMPYFRKKMIYEILTVQLL
ncbi:sentrin-specific protease 1-like [Phymastichus coffea]|uniref:sentrin-specific protease 1-like n=1 Tax=Phymastichus coffea TaxID=108790 RepID=UPI00273CBF05|nr:sentrin-specific protease 1-like [Phymastichus coffea]